MSGPLLSKTSFMHFLECPIWLWLEKVRPELLPPDDPDARRAMDQGKIIDDLARRLFPGGIEVRGYNGPGFENTRIAIEKGAKVLYQPTAVADGLSARADILTMGRGGKWDIHEVKAATSVEDKYVSDLAFQRTCFERAGIPIGKTFLVHINNKYVRKGEVEVAKLLTEEDITDDVRLMLPEVGRQIPDARAVLSWPKALDVAHAEFCPKLEKCEYIAFWTDSLKLREREAFLRGLPPVTVAKMLEKLVIDPGMLSERFLESVGYRSPEERWPHMLDAPGIRKWLKPLEYPLHFLDYETYWPAIPPFDGYRPYQQIPFQFSAHVINKPNAKPREHDFLMQTFDDPAPSLIDALKKAIGPKGSVIVWNQTFEKGRNEEMASRHPEHAKFLRGVNDRVFDLMLVFKKSNRLIVNPGFRGSASLKAVMPTLISDLSYKKLNIQEGGTASASWPVLTDSNTPEGERKELYKDMIDYCRLDVHGMVRILDYLRKIAGIK